jgi:hypothetical protein
VQDLDSLISQADRLEKSFNHWNTAYLYVVAISVLLFAAIFSLQWMSNHKAAQLDVVRKLVIKGKDNLLKIELAEKDRQIAVAQQAAGEADDRAGIANNSAAQANVRAGVLENEALTARNRLEELHAENLATESKLAAANLELEKEKGTRLELEKSLAPRSFEIKVADSPNSNFEQLKPFGGTNVIFEVLTDAEARRAANEIGNLVGFAGWKVVSVESHPELWPGFFDGVSIVPPGGFTGGFPGQVDGDKLAIRRKTIRAAEALALWLIERNWKASVRNNITEAGEVPDDTLKIFIGFKPNPFFEPDWVKDIEKTYEKILKEQKRRQEEIDKQFRQPPSQD